MRAAFLALALVAGAPASAQALAEPTPRVASLQAELRTAPHPAAIHVLGDGEDYGAASGWADIDQKRPFTTDTPLRIASWGLGPATLPRPAAPRRRSRPTSAGCDR